MARVRGAMRIACLSKLSCINVGQVKCKQRGIKFAALQSSGVFDPRGSRQMETVHAPKGYMLPCYIGLGYPAKDAAVLEQVERPVAKTLHFGKW